MINIDDLVPYEGTQPGETPRHFRTLVLLRLYDAEGGPVYFVVRGLGNPTIENDLDDTYFYDEHTCPTNYVDVEAIMTPDDDDPHGIFDYIVTRWMPKEYPESNDKDGTIRELFPEISGGPIIEGTATSGLLGIR